jgi:hypothetical protein
MENDYDNHFNQAEEAYKNNDYMVIPPQNRSIEK